MTPKVSWCARFPYGLWTQLAAKACDKKAIELFGEFAWLIFPPEAGGQKTEDGGQKTDDGPTTGR